MPRLAPVLTSRQRTVLERLSRSRTEEQRYVERANMVLLAARGLNGPEIAECLGCEAQRVRRWLHRWRDHATELENVERDDGSSEVELEQRVRQVLFDEPRSGGPVHFGPEVVAQLISLACEPPADSGLPINRWTPDTLALEAVKRGIVESISARHLDRILKRGGPTAAQEPVLDDVQGQAR